jgi:hypothetical protein
LALRLCFKLVFEDKVPSGASLDTGLAWGVRLRNGLGDGCSGAIVFVFVGIDVGHVLVAVQEGIMNLFLLWRINNNGWDVLNGTESLIFKLLLFAVATEGFVDAAFTILDQQNAVVSRWLLSLWLLFARQVKFVKLDEQMFGCAEDKDVFVVVVVAEIRNKVDVGLVVELLLELFTGKGSHFIFCWLQRRRREKIQRKKKKINKIN